MTPIQFSECQSPKYEKQLTIKMTSIMLEHIKAAADNLNITISDATRYLLYLGISSLDDQ